MKDSNLFKYMLTSLISILLISLTVILLIMKIIPIKYILIGISCLSILSVGIIILLFKVNKIWTSILSTIYSLILLILLIIVLSISFKTGNTINKLTNVQYETIGYSVITLKSNTDDILSYNNKNIGIVKDMMYSKEAEKELNKKVTVTVNESDNIDALTGELISKNIDTILIENNYLDVLEEFDPKVLGQIKTIYTFNIKVEQKDIKKEVNVTRDPFIVLISGIDTAGYINTVSRSDVNIIMVVNPKTHRVLLVDIPRDYYVTFHNIGVKDKLTHTGLYGIDMTVSTVEDLMDIDINYYVRINFSSFTKFIDLIGNIELYNPVAFSDGGIYFKKGNITLNSKKALVFSRARKMLKGGDYARGINQERVISSIIKKMSTPDVAKKAYDILDVMSDSFVTNLSSDELKKLINFELDYLPNWEVETYILGGPGMYTKGTPLYPYLKLYVTNPDYNTIKIAKDSINDIMNK